MKHKCPNQQIRIFGQFYLTHKIWFHLLGIACILWFLFRVLPAPHRARYPCQQMSLTIAVGYIAFLGIIFAGVSTWLKQAKTKTAAALPLLLVIFLLVFMITGPVFAGLNFNNNFTPSFVWDPIPKEPIGTPVGVNPGRVVWVWNPDATEKDLSGFWWETQNNDQNILDEMFSTGVQSLAGTNDDHSAWDRLFRYFNEHNGYGNVSYISVWLP